MVGMSKAKAENRALPKRFYTAALARDGRIWLDGKELKTQGRKPLILPDALADAVAAEWQAQETHIDPEHMPLTRLANVAIDRAAIDRDAWLATIAAFGETDLLCYRDPAIADRQASQFDPVLAWAAATHGIELACTESVLPLAQPATSQAALTALLQTASDSELTGLAMLVPLLGSAVLGVAVWQGQVPVEAAIAMARLDETAQAERWGPDDEAEALHAQKQKEIRAAAFFLTFKQLN